MGLPGIPEDKLPPCWSDDVRMNALFAPFRIKTANPESWDMKMKFWSDMLRQWCKCKKDPIISAADAKFSFQRKGRTPACIDIVVEELCRSGDLSPLSKYQQILHNGPEGWVRWGARLAFKPAAFALTAVSSLLPGRQSLDNDGLPKASIDSTQRWVVESAVKEQATELLNSYPSHEERIGTIDELMKNCAWPGSRETFEVLLGYLVAQGAAVKKDEIVKIAQPDKKATPVTETDEALVKLMTAESRLGAELTRLARDVTSAESDARAALQLGNKLAAKNHLRRKLKAQQRATRCESTLENVRHLLQQTREADVNAAIVDTYKTTADAMKRGMKEGGLEEDAVYDTIDELKEVMDTYNEVEKALSSTVEEYDAQELEDELKELLAKPGPPGGGTPGKEEKTEKPKEKTRKESERDFVFDGEERILAELEQLDVEHGSPKEKRTEEKKKIPVTEEWETELVKPQPKSTKPSQSWYPPSTQSLRPETWNNNLDSGEMRQDHRIHPGQPLNIDFTTPPRLYNSDFQVRDQKFKDGVWLYNTRDANSNVDSELGASTEYFRWVMMMIIMLKGL
ncbi:charged multivesicular body protein 7 [Ostrinia nubilalis]|uniref:charged multivesicular body protein 7 n=1 Tax=Ostrinia nubilalis TaxID=29057 RepID=UPI0030826274